MGGGLGLNVGPDDVIKNNMRSDETPSSLCNDD